MLKIILYQKTLMNIIYFNFLYFTESHKYFVESLIINNEYTLEFLSYRNHLN